MPHYDPTLYTIYLKTLHCRNHIRAWKRNKIKENLAQKNLIKKCKVTWTCGKKYKAAWTCDLEIKVTWTRGVEYWIARKNLNI